MKHFKRLTFRIINSSLGLVGCVKKEVDLKPIKTIIEDIGVSLQFRHYMGSK